jgi:hypothetical protein
MNRSGIGDILFELSVLLHFGLERYYEHVHRMLLMVMVVSGNLQCGLAH